jgi:hypothetical protein
VRQAAGQGRDAAAGGEQGLARPLAPCQDEAALQGRDQRVGQRAGVAGSQAAAGEVAGALRHPRHDHLGPHQAQFGLGVRDLPQDGADRAQVRPPGALHRLGGLGERGLQPGRQVVVLAQDQRDQPHVRGAALPQRRGGDLPLALLEMVVDGADRRARRLRQLLDAGGGVALVAHQLGHRGDDPLACGHACILEGSL